MKAEDFHPIKYQMGRNYRYLTSLWMNRGFGVVEFATMEEALKCLAEFLVLGQTIPSNILLQVRPLCQLQFPDVIGSACFIADIEEYAKELAMAEPQPVDSKEEPSPPIALNTLNG